MITLPADYLNLEAIQPVGIVLGHGADAEDWKGPLLSSIANHFARKGHVVMRYYCTLKDARRQRIFGHAYDTAMTSPFGRRVQKWIFIGYDNGARIAACVGGKVQSHLVPAGFVFLSYPLRDPMPPPPKVKVGGALPADSIPPLLKISEMKVPLLFINGEMDGVCPGAELKAVLEHMNKDADPRAVVMHDLGRDFGVYNEEGGGGGGGRTMSDDTIKKILGLLDAFALGVAQGALSVDMLPRLADLVPSDRVPSQPVPTQGQEQDYAEVKTENPSSSAAARHVPLNPLVAQQLIMQQLMVLNQQKEAMGGVLTPEQLQIQQQLQLQLLLIQQQMAAAAAAVANCKK